MIKAKHLGRYKDLALLFSRYGRKDFKLQPNTSDPLLQEAVEDKPLEADVKARAEGFANALLQMGPAYIKFGQVLSTRPDFVPREYIDALEALQDQVEPFPYDEVEQIIESELKVKISRLFDTFEKVPIAAASLGQAHRATLRDGREVVVKVQRPNVRELLENDLEIFGEIAEFFESHSTVGQKLNMVQSVEQVRRTMLAEVNYLQEAHNMKILRRTLAEFPQIYIPGVLEDLTTGKVLTTELVHGKKVSKLTPLELIDHDYADLAAVLTRAYLKQICVDGFWHSDPHPGNIFVREGELVLLDFGMVSRINGEFQDLIIKLLLGITENRGTEVMEVCIKLGKVMRGFDREKFGHDISQIVTTYYDADMTRVNVGQLLLNVIAIANANQLQVPSELAMLAKTLLHLDGITRRLDPNFDPQTVIQDYAENLIVKKLRQKFHPRNFYTPLLDLNQLLIDLPRRSRDLIDQVSTGRLTLNVKIDQTEDFLTGMHKIANRISVSMVIAALIIGSSLMMRVPTSFRLFGYPGIAVIGYLAASAIGFYLVITTLLHDKRDKEQARAKAVDP